MANRIALILLSVCFVVGAVTNFVLAQGGIPPTMRTVIECGGTEDDGGRKTQEGGSVCDDYPCNSQVGRQLAVDDANLKVVDSLKKDHVCEVCDEDTGQKCTEQEPIITSPFTIADCTFTCTSGCDDDADKTKIKASCEAVMGWSIGCDDCPPGGGGSQ